MQASHPSMSAKRSIPKERPQLPWSQSPNCKKPGLKKCEASCQEDFNVKQQTDRPSLFSSRTYSHERTTPGVHHSASVGDGSLLLFLFKSSPSCKLRGDSSRWFGGLCSGVGSLMQVQCLRSSSHLASLSRRSWFGRLRFLGGAGKLGVQTVLSYQAVSIWIIGTF
jgi:hypothetical protein